MIVVSTTKKLNFMEVTKDVGHLEKVKEQVRISTKPRHRMRILNAEVVTTDPDKWLLAGATYVGEMQQSENADISPNFGL